MPEPIYTSQGAVFDEPARVYRYRLWREWDPSRFKVLFVMLNPSTADEAVLDPTLRRCCGYAQAWGFGGFQVVNLFALRSTDPAGLRRVADPVGPENDRHLVEAAGRARLVVAGWGVHGGERADRVLELLAPVATLHALRLTNGGAPGHPLYLPSSLEPFVWRERKAVE